MKKVNKAQLNSELNRRISGEVRFDEGSRALYSTDASNYRQIPIGVVIPRSKQDVIETVAVCREFDVPVLSRGGGTSLAGQCCNVAVVIDFSKYLNKVIEINREARTAVVQPGVVLDKLRDAAEEYQLTFGPDPATHNHCTLGGMVGNNSCGVHSIMAGKTVDNIEELEILTYEDAQFRVGKTSDDILQSLVNEDGPKGEIYRRLLQLRDKYANLIRQNYPDIPRRVSGYNLDDLLPEKGFNVARALVGTESTCVTILEIVVRLLPSPQARTLLVLGYSDIFQAGDHVPEIMKSNPIGLEGLDRRLINYMKKKHLRTHERQLLPEGGGWLLVEFGGENLDESDSKAKKLMEKLKKDLTSPTMKLYDDREQEKEVWEVRESGLGATAHIPGEETTWPGWEDAAIHPDSLGDYLRDFRDLLQKYDYDAALYGHFGQGCIHTRLPIDLKTAAGIRHYRAFIDEASDLVMKYNGSFSGEHGDGQSRAELLGKMYGTELLDAFREFKSIWDPRGKMNPGKVVDPYRIDENLRLGTNYNPAQKKTNFNYPEDHGNFAKATLRCVGVGQCRREDGGTMCPSYMVTKEEKHSTRGRARLLFEMLQGEAITRGWRDPHIKEALDLCLACKGCKNDCPVNVDMATYKAEFFSHYYEHRIRPLTAYSMGLIYWWARVASHAPSLANFLTQTQGLGTLPKRLAGVSTQRQIPVFAKQTFRKWFDRRAARKTNRKPASAKRVILWPDTFNNHFHPETAVAAVQVLERSGFDVTIPQVQLCCGRPLYDYGMLHLAKRQLRQILNTLQQEIQAGIPIVGLEPSCVSVFRDELTNLFPHDENARRLAKQTFSLSEFLIQQKVEDFPHLNRKALIHGHCHHKSVLDFDAEKKLLTNLGLELDMPETGCCGMAGSFGFEKEKYDVSVKCGERVLLPAVRQADEQTLIVTSGFSCREQIHQLTKRKSFHLAELLYMSLETQTQNGRRESSFRDVENELLAEVLHHA